MSLLLLFQGGLQGVVPPFVQVGLVCAVVSEVSVPLGASPVKRGPVGVSSGTSDPVGVIQVSRPVGMGSRAFRIEGQVSECED